MLTSVVAIDVETEPFNTQVRRVRDRVHVPPLVCCQMVSAEGEELLLPGTELHDRLWWVLSDPGVTVVGHNFSFDLRVLLQEFPDLTDLAREAVLSWCVLDTMVMAHLREPDVDDKKLDALAEQYLGVRLSKDLAVRTSFRRGVDLTPVQREYAMSDARATLRLAAALDSVPLGSVCKSRIERFRIPCPVRHDLPTDLDRVYSACAIASGVWVESRGWAIDSDRLTILRDETRAAAETALAGLVEAGLAEPARDTDAPTVVLERTTAPRKWTYRPEAKRWERFHRGQAQAQATRWKLNTGCIRSRFLAAATDLGVEVQRTAGGDVATRYAFWKPYRVLLSKELQAYLDYAKAQKLESAFFASWTTSSTGELYPQYWIPGTATLRHASSKPNLQQVPKRLRPILHRPGKVLVSADYTALESYTLVHHMACLGIRGPLLQMLQSGGDIHSYGASLLAGGTPADHPKGSTTRQIAKAATFGLPGGLGPEKFYLLGRNGYGLSWTLPEATALRERYLEIFWDVNEYLQRLRDKRPSGLRPVEVGLEEWLEELGFQDGWPGNFELAKALDEGRIFDVELSTGMRVPARNFTQAANLPFQHLGAVIITFALVEALRAGLDVAAAVHDALYVAADPAEAESAAKTLEVCMNHAFERVCPEAPPQQVKAEIKKEFF